MAKIDRRLFTRHKTCLAAEVITSRGVYSAQVTEISLYGLRMQSVHAINPGTPVVICIQLNGRILFRGNIMWTMDHSGKYGINYSMGSGIESMEFFDQKATGLSDRRELMDQILCSINEDAEVANG